MSVVAQALVMVMARTLAGKTWAEDRVLEQPINPITDVLRASNGSGKPVVAVYVESAEGDPAGLETQRGAQSVVMKIMAYAPPAWELAQDEVTFSFEDESAALALNVLGRQIDAGLHFGNAPWIEIFRGLAKSIKKRRLRYLLIELDDGVRIPAIELTYDFEVTVAEPGFGKPLFGKWIDFDQALRDTNEAAVADMFKALIEQPAGLPDYEVFRANANLSVAAHRAMGPAPVVTDDGDVPTAEAIDSDIDQMTIWPPDEPDDA